jgi:autotransporter passenger strand-loop-strand repeat protein
MTQITISNGVSSSISSSTTNTYLVQSGGTLTIASGGSVSDTQVQQSGTFTVNSGGSETGAVISAGGTMTVSSGGSASGDVIVGTMHIISTGATAVNNETIESGGVLTISKAATVSNTILISGGTVDLLTGAATLKGALTFSGGSNTLIATAPVNTVGADGDLAVISGFSSTDKIVISGITAATASFTTSGTNELVDIMSSGTVEETYLFSGTSTYNSSTLSLVASGGAFDLEFTSAGSTGSTTSVTTSTASGAFTETSGNTLLVLNGGSVSAATIDNGAFLVVSGGGQDFAATISSGGTETVSSGGSATGDFIFGTLNTISGGNAVLTNETVEAGGTLNLLNGNSAAGTTVLSGGLFLLSGANGAVTNTVLSGGGTLELDSPKANISGSLTFEGGGNTLDIAAVASSGFGDLATISGFSSTDKIDITAIGTGATLAFATSGGNEDVTAVSGGTSETFIFSGTSTYTSTTLAVVSSGGHEYIEYNSNGAFGSTTSVTTSTGSGSFTETSGNTLLVLNGGSVSAAKIDNGAFLVVSSGGQDFAATISSGGSEIVSTGGAVSGDTISGNATASGTGATVTSETVANGGTLTVNTGAVDSGTVVSAGGSEAVAGSASGDQIFGQLSVSGGTVTSETIENGGSATLGAGAVDSGMIVSSGGQVSVAAATGSATLSGDQIYGVVSTSSGLSATFTDETVHNGGLLILANSNNATGTTVLSGGELLLSGHETATNTTLSGGGLVELDSPKATLSGSLIFEGGGNTLELNDDSDSGDGDLALISGFSSTDAINITSAAFAFSALTLSQTTSGGNTVATITSGGTAVETIDFAGTALDGNLSLVSNGSGGSILEITPATGTTVVNTATASGAYTETAGNTLEVVGGGNVIAPIIENGAFLVISGGVDSGADIQAGGLETLSAGSASGDQIYGSAVVSAGTVTSETVQSGGSLTMDGGSATDTLLDGGATLDLSDPSATLSGTLTFANGGNSFIINANPSVGAGDQAVISGYSTSDKIEVAGISGATLSFSAGPNGEEIATVSGTNGGSPESVSFIFANGTTYNASTMSLAPDGSGVDLVLDTTPVVNFTTLNNLTTNNPDQIINGTVDTATDPYAIGTTVSVMENGQVIGTGTVGANGYWSASVGLLDGDGANTLSATDTDKAGNTGTTSSSLSYNVNTTAPEFTVGDLVVSVSGDGDGSGVYGDNQASPLTLDEITTAGTIVSQLVLPQTQNGDNDAVSAEYGSSSEGTLELSTNGEELVIAGYGINADTFNTGGAAVYGNAALAQSTSVQGGEFTAVARVIAGINADGVVDSSTALYDVFNTNNPRSVATVDGTSFYISGQGVKGDTTQGVFYATDGASSATSINDKTDTRTVEIYNGDLYVSADSTQGATGIYDYGAVSGLTSGPITPSQIIPGSVVLNGTNGNTVNGGDTGQTVNLSPENFFFANSTTLYVADGGDPKNGGIGDGGLQKWSFNGTQWVLDYTLSAGLNLVPDTSSSGSSGLIGLAGKVVGNTVELFATNETLTDIAQTYVYQITDTLGDTTAAEAAGESFTAILGASAGENIRGISFAPSENAAPCYCPGTLIATERGSKRVEQLRVGDEVRTASGKARPIKWIGRRSYSGRFVTGRKDVLPVCIKAGALEDNVPQRDLWISPHHAMFFKNMDFKNGCLDGVLIEAKDLVNGVSIVQAQRVDKVEYFHIELESHDVIVAEGALSESFVDDNSRDMFHNAGEYWATFPGAAAEPAQYCAPRLDDGYEVETARRRIALRAGLVSSNEQAGIGRLRGFVDCVAGDRVTGWAQNEDHPEAPVCLDIYAGGKTVGQVLANRYRSDLERSGFGSGHHGFEFRLPPGLAIAGDVVEVRRSVDGVALALTTHGSRRRRDFAAAS